MNPPDTAIVLLPEDMDRFDALILSYEGKIDRLKEMVEDSGAEIRRLKAQEAKDHKTKMGLQLRLTREKEYSSLFIKQYIHDRHTRELFKSFNPDSNLKRIHDLESQLDDALGELKLHKTKINVYG